MGRGVVTMETKVAAMLAEVSARRLSVSAVCAELGISRQTYYKWRRRFEEEGLAGLEPRSRRPGRSPAVTSAATSRLIVAARAALEAEGWDNGATSIFFRLCRDGEQPPSVRTIHRVLVRAGLVRPEPRKRPRSSYRRFEFPAADDCWQIDAYEHRLNEASKVVVFELKDDCSRFLLDVLAWPDEDTLGAWTCLGRAMANYGKPLMLLSDNSLAFTGRRLRSEVLFEKNLTRLGIKALHSTPRHPQTNGKTERGHATARRWLAHQPDTDTTDTVEDLQVVLDRYRDAFNDRPHQGLDGRTPREQHAASVRTAPRPTLDPTHPTFVSTPTASSRGAIGVGGVVLGLGVEYAGLQLSCFTTDDHVLVFYQHHLVHEFDIDRTRSYQHPVRPRSGPVRHPLPG